MPVLTGLDTGVFVLHSKGHAEAGRLWDEAVSGRRQAVVSAITLFELLRLGLRGTVTPEYAAAALKSIPDVCEVVWIENLDLLSSAGRLSHGVGLSSSDALILASLIDRKCTEIYTVDGDLLRYQAAGVQVVGLRRP